MRPPVSPQRKPVTGDDGGPVDISAAQDARIAASVRYFEGEYRNPPPGGPRAPRRGAFAGMVAVTNAAIAAGTATTPTSGTVTFRKWSGSTLAADTVTATAFNYHDKIIASGSLVFIALALGAWWIIDVRSCTNLS